MSSDPPREPREPRGPKEARGGGVPLHDDEQTALAAVHVLVHVEDAHDVGAARCLPVLLHLLPGLGAVVQDLGAAQTDRGTGSSGRPGTCPRAPSSRGTKRGCEDRSPRCGVQGVRSAPRGLAGDPGRPWEGLAAGRAPRPEQPLPPFSGRQVKWKLNGWKSNGTSAVGPRPGPHTAWHRVVDPESESGGREGPS